MPALILIAILLGVVVLMTVMIPLSIVMRYRAGTARRRAWGWVVWINFFAATVSAMLLVVTAAVSDHWIPNAFRYTLLGLAIGFALGVLGLASSRWEAFPRELHYTPNRWLILMITVVVSSRILYGFWRAWHAWRITPGDQSWLANSGAAGSMGAGAAILGYYLIYWMGVQRKLWKHRGSAHDHSSTARLGC